MNKEIKNLKQAENGQLDVMKNVIPALVLILVGVGLLARNFLGISFDNWWALFLLIPVVVLSHQVWRDYKGNGRLTSRGVGSLVGSLVLASMLVTFLFDLDWGQLWPLFLIFGGIATLLGRKTK